MRLTTLFPQFRGLRLDHVCAATGGITLVATSTAQSARCPLCRQRSRRTHSRYRHHVLDLPCAGRAVTLLFHTRRFFFLTPDCPRQTFRERLPALVAPGALRSHGLRAALERIGFALGGEAGSRLAAMLGMPASADRV